MQAPLRRTAGSGRLYDKAAPTTVWGVAIAAGLVSATLALNAPGGSTSIAGRGLTWTMTRLFPPRPAPTTPASVRAPASPPPSGQLRTAPVTPVMPAAPSSPEAKPEAAPANTGNSPAATRRSATQARAHMAHAPAGVEFRNVYAVTILGVFNASEPGTPFLGFCGEISVPAGEGWGRPGWKPFFVSETVSTPAGQTPFLDQANPGTLAKCANAKPSQDYSDVFNAGPTDQGLEPWQRHPLGAPAPAP